MGLDNFWKMDNENNGSVEGDYKVCGGIFTDNGNDSFRGKVYNSIIENITGVSLYESEITAPIVEQMNKQIQECTYKTAKSYSQYDLEEKEWEDFQRMWNDHAEAGHYLVSWY